MWRANSGCGQTTPKSDQPASFDSATDATSLNSLARTVASSSKTPARSTDEHRVTCRERNVLHHPAVSPARTFSSSVMAESCARMWLDHGRVHDGYKLGRWSDAH